MASAVDMAKGRQGHPARQSRAQKRAAWFRPDRDEAHIREIARRWRQQRNERKEDGDISGLLAVAADLSATELQNVLRELSGEEHHVAITEYLYGCWGELLHRFNPGLPLDRMMVGLPSYYEWRARA